MSLRRIREIELADFKVTSYTRTMQRAVDAGDAERTAEYAGRAQAASEQGRALRIAWLKDRWEQQTKRRKGHSK